MSLLHLHQSINIALQKITYLKLTSFIFMKYVNNKLASIIIAF